VIGSFESTANCDGQRAVTARRNAVALLRVSPEVSPDAIFCGNFRQLEAIFLQRVENYGCTETPMFSRAWRTLAISGEEARKILLAFFSAVLYQLSYLATGKFLARNGLYVYRTRSGVSRSRVSLSQRIARCHTFTWSSWRKPPTRSTQCFSQPLDGAHVPNSPKTPAQPVLNGFSS
jgi:hypothetical protein